MSNKSKAASSKEIYKSFQVRYVGLQGVASLIEVALGNPKTFMQDAANQLDASRYISSYFFMELGPGRPPAGGPRMDRWAVTSPGVVKISRLASRLRRSARRGPDPTAVLIKLFMKMLLLIQKYDGQGAPNDQHCY